MTTKRPSRKWQFETRFRRRSFGWKSKPAIQRVKEAVSEIKKVSRKDPVLAAEGAVRFLQKVSPALEQVDSSSGAIGTAVNRAIAALVPIISNAPADVATRALWLKRLFEAHAADEIPYIELLADHWGEMCASKQTASEWADRLIDATRMALSPDPALHGHFHGTSAGLSALFAAERHDEIVALVRGDIIWPYKLWAVKALAAQGKRQDAIEYAEAYRRYGLTANRAGTYVAWFRAVKKKYSHKKPREILADLIDETPGEEGKWFAAAKDAMLFEEAIALANRTPTDPRTLTSAAFDFAEKNHDFAVEAGMAALRTLVLGYGYEITGADVWDAFSYTMKAAERQGSVEATRQRIRNLVASETFGERFVTKILGRELGLSEK